MAYNGHWHGNRVGIRGHGRHWRQLYMFPVGIAMGRGAEPDMGSLELLESIPRAAAHPPR